jgi:ketosteroid isomerase-like protein
MGDFMPAHRIRRPSLLALVGLLATAACSSSDADRLAPELAASAGEGAEASGAAQLDLREVRAELLAADRAYSAASASTNFLDGLAATLADDVRYLPANGPIVRGRDQVRAFLAGNAANAVSIYTWTPIRADVSSDGAMGLTYGYYQLQIPASGTLPARVAIGKYIATWRRTEGAWKVTALVRGPRPAGPVSDVPPAGFETPTTKHQRYLPNTDPASTLAEIMETDRAFSRAGEIDLPVAFADFAAPNGAGMGGGASFVFGRAAILQEAPALDPTQTFTWAPVEGEAAASGDFGWTVGIGVVRERATGALLGYNKYLTVWQRQDDDSWRYLIDGGSGMPTP